MAATGAATTPAATAATAMATTTGTRRSAVAHRPAERVPPEGITTGSRHTAYLGSLADGDIYQLDLRTGEGDVISEGPGTPSVGLKLAHDWLFVSGGSAGNARMVDARSGQLLATYTLEPAGTPSFINDVIVTDKAAWFTDSLDNAALPDLAAPRPRPRDGTTEAGTHHGHHGHHSLPSQADVEKVDLTGAWVQGAGNNANGITTDAGRQGAARDQLEQRGALPRRRGRRRHGGRPRRVRRHERRRAAPRGQDLVRRAEPAQPGCGLQARQERVPAASCGTRSPRPTSTFRPRSRGPTATSTCRTRGSRRRPPRPRRTG